MKVLMLNGSPHERGCVRTALDEVAGELEKNGVASEFLWIGSQAVRGCVACGGCRTAGACVFREPLYDGFLRLAKECDALVVGSPVYYAAPNGSLCAFLDRAFYSAGTLLRHKPAAAVVNCRRGGASAAFDRLNKYFTLNEMPVVSSQYWNSTHGCSPDEVRQDLEGLQTMRTLGRDMAHLLRALAAAAPAPEREPWIKTNFIR